MHYIELPNLNNNYYIMTVSKDVISEIIICPHLHLKIHSFCIQSQLNLVSITTATCTYLI